VYDMYHWDRPVPATEKTGNTSRAHARSRRPAAAVQAVQVALDRRDNGGDASDPRDQFGRGGGAGYQCGGAGYQ
jgi:hypothetical protein